MNVVFFCQSCGSRFEVDAVHAGKTARCKKCGQRTQVPKPTELASMAAMPAVPAQAASGAARADAAAAPRAVPKPAAARPRPSSAALAASANWIAAVNSSVGLAPLTESAIPIARRAKPKGDTDGPAGFGNLDDWDNQDSKPYALATPARTPSAARRGGGKAAGFVKQHWRNELGSVQKIFRKLNEVAYLISIPFLMMIILGTAFQSRSIALLGAVVVIVLNLSRLATGLANVLVVPFRESPMQGVLFLIPPFMFTYSSKNWSKMEKPVKRVMGPLLTIGAVILAFAFIPTLRGDQASTATDPLGKLRAGVSDLKSAVQDKAGQARGEIEKLETKASASGVLPPAK